jgi:peptidoglycan/LPS O-acetylase OafA/YrhL
MDACSGRSARAATTQLHRLTSLRWFAALAVFIDHVGLHSGRQERIFAALGFAGVDLFFVLSGIVLSWSAPSGDTAREFYWRRFGRIYPATMVASAVAVAATLAFAGHVRWSVGGTVLFVLLLQAWSPASSWPLFAYNGPVWTLSCEAFFYALFPWLRRLMTCLSPRTLASTASALVVLGGVVTLSNPWSVGAHLPLLRLPEFIVGMAIGTGLRRGYVPRVPVIPALMVYISLLFVATLTIYGWLVMLPGAAMLLTAAAGADLRRKRSWLTDRRLVYLGELSFCFYLIHEVVVTTLARTGAHGWTLLAALPIATLAAATLHHVVELPMQRWLLRSSHRASAHVRARASQLAEV